MTSQQDTELDDIIFAHNSRIDSYHHSIREKGLTPDQRLAGEDEIAIRTKQALTAWKDKEVERIKKEYGISE